MNILRLIKSTSDYLNNVYTSDGTNGGAYKFNVQETSKVDKDRVTFKLVERIPNKVHAFELYHKNKKAEYLIYGNPKPSEYIDRITPFLYAIDKNLKQL
jgi:hypothetical protein